MESPVRQRLLNFLVALRRMPPLSELSGNEERLLFELYRLAVMRDEGLSVADAYALGGKRSASAAYRDLMTLKDKGLVEITPDPGDRRKRRIVFTPSAEALFARFT